MNILVTGASGQLGSEIKEVSKYYKTNHQFFFENSSKVNITDKVNINKYIENNNINVVINCAAYTAVDKAESESELAENVNAEGVKNLISALPKEGKLIHISTDYVFNGQSHLPYQETDEVNPLGVYGSTKRNGEQYVIDATIQSIIIRTSWVYSSYGHNFVKTMLRLGTEKGHLRVISDQIGTPTYAKDLAKLCLSLIDKNLSKTSKIYHYSNEGVASWYDFAKSIMELGEIDCKLIPIETKDYPTLAQRPSYSLLNKSKIKRDFSIEIPHWRDSLKQCIEIIAKK
ncbi:dTDP-4-dehydrorhamnose reductase [Tenacibaculum sp. MAR_2009_124]|uniref:dTDP-4-dehydrorhamnose reductase n=1 Tax=Tenacibaculum sp. MAR_2009_124 TaxID=1250059 RepID=UPI00089A62DE|nr:dTDP-4-dehydrorhamnose reductase [Tenacibaculum sp. MAR_2009_124]SEB42465.1 dTDP-4-dehydrorhamnose reductase [Tenacibaculum sp. MAR_2009_124]